MWLFTTITVYFRTRIRGGQLDMLEKAMVFTTLKKKVCLSQPKASCLINSCQSLYSLIKKKILPYHCWLGHPNSTSFFRLLQPWILPKTVWVYHLNQDRTLLSMATIIIHRFSSSITSFNWKYLLTLRSIQMVFSKNRGILSFICLFSLKLVLELIPASPIYYRISLWYVFV